jgi:hypothetical protein
MTRLKLIKTILELHNFFCVQSTKSGLWDMSDRTFDMSLLETKKDRFYLVESLKTISEEDDKKSFSPVVEVRYHLRSAEANAYGSGHSYFYQRFIPTISFSFENIDNTEKYKENLLIQFAEQLKQNAE